MSIHLVPEFIMHQIFEYLDEKSLSSAFNVCKSWSQMMESSPFLVKSLAIKIERCKKYGQIIHIPIEGFRYKKMHYKGRIYTDSQQMKVHQKYREGIQHLVLENFTCDRQLFEDFENITKLEIYGDCDAKLISQILKFEKLTDLELRINSVDAIKILRNEKFQLSTIKVKITESPDRPQSYLYSCILDRKKILKELSFTNFPIPSKCVRLIFKMKKLTKVKLEIDTVEDNQTIIMSHYWRILKFVNPGRSYRNFILNTLKTGTNFKTLSVTYNDSGTSLSSSQTIFEDIPNFKTGLFSFIPFERTEEYLNHLEQLSIKRIDNESQIKQLIKILEKCPNLKSLDLNLISNRAKFDQNLIPILVACKSLEQLTLDAYSERLNISFNTFNALTSLNTSLKKLTMKISHKQIQEMNVKALIISAKIQTVVMEKQIKQTCLENYESYSDENDSFCIMIK
ncbi:uncharacterized protein [Chironomus tepperi]|uniref:uncharacterized protein n=1 Tax=Chironomus tepperi TaxID=113505 RepID=UPI00391F2BA9